MPFPAIESPVRTLPAAFALALVLNGCHRLPSPGVELGDPPARIEWQLGEGRVLVRPAPADLRIPPAGGKDWSNVLAVTVVGGDGTPMLGDYSTTVGADGERSIRFASRFAMEPGRSYRATFLGGTARMIESTATVPLPPKTEPGAVTHVYPSADELPENLLRLYVHFSEPMRRGEAYDRIRLLDEAGQAVPTPFLTLGEELWDETGRRLTLFFDPGRIKRGLKPREDLGPILEAGKNYTLVIDRQWRDAHGQPLRVEFRKRLHVSRPADFGIDCAQWSIEPPAAGTRSPLIVRFSAPLDHALLLSMIAVARSGGEPLAGRVTVADHERSWRFEPKEPWPAGDFELVVHRALEDVAGNRIGRPFEVDADARPLHSDGPPVRRPFVIR